MSSESRVEIPTFSDTPERKQVVQLVTNFVENSAIIKEAKAKLSIAALIETELKLAEIFRNRAEQRMHKWKLDHCGLLCDTCKDNGKCIVGVYQARRR